MLYTVYIYDVYVGYIYAEPWSRVVTDLGRCMLVLDPVPSPDEAKRYKPRIYKC